MSNQPPNPPTPPPGGGEEPSWPASPPDGGGQPPAQPPAQPPSQPPGQQLPPPAAEPPATQPADDGGFGGSSMPPPPPGDGGGGMVPAGPYSPSDAITYGWQKFTANLGPIIAAELLLFIGVILVAVVLTFVTGGFDRALEGTTATVDIFVNLLVGFLSLLVSAAIVRAALAIVDGRKLDFSEFFRMEQMGQVVIAAILIALANAISGLIPVLGLLLGLAISIFGQFIMYFILDDGLDAIPAITASVSFVAAHLGQVLILILLSIVVIIVGALLCGVGLLAAWPVVLIAFAYTFRRLRDQPVAA